MPRSTRWALARRFVLVWLGRFDSDENRDRYRDQCRPTAAADHAVAALRLSGCPLFFVSSPSGTERQSGVPLSARN